MLTEVGNEAGEVYLKKDRVWLVRELDTGGFEAMMVLDKGTNDVPISDEYVPALTTGMTELITTDNCRVWVDAARVVLIENWHGSFWQVTLQNGEEIHVFDVSPLLEATK